MISYCASTSWSSCSLVRVIRIVAFCNYVLYAVQLFNRVLLLPFIHPSLFITAHSTRDTTGRCINLLIVSRFSDCSRWRNFSRWLSHFCFYFSFCTPYKIYSTLRTVPRIHGDLGCFDYPSLIMIAKEIVSSVNASATL